MAHKIQFYLIKLPFILFLIALGFIFEFLITLPFAVLCTLDNWLERKD
jgi:hypothetical protein